MDFKELPTEILHKVFEHVVQKVDIHNARLVSRRVNEIASAFLIQKIHVHMTSESLSDLETLCQHAVYRKSIREVIIVVFYYDVDLSENLAFFAENCSTMLYQHSEVLERAYGYESYDPPKDPKRLLESNKNQETLQTLFKISSSGDIAQIGNPSFNEETATPAQKFVLRLHKMYRQRCLDQEEVRKDNQHISRICSALQNLPSLQHVGVRDGRWVRNETFDVSDFLDLGFDRRVLRHFYWSLAASRWCGSFTTAYSTKPPTEMLGELCSRLGEAGIRPRSFDVRLNTPANLQCLELMPGQEAGVLSLVSKAKNLTFELDSWARKASLAENNDRLRSEMLSLCSFTKIFFTAPNLEHLRIHFRGYPCFYETPTVTLADILPMQKPWPQLTSIELGHQPTTVEEVGTLVAGHRETMRSFEWNTGWLVRGPWNELIEALRGFRSLERAVIKYPRGERYGDGRGRGPEVPYDEMHDYIMKKTADNPLNETETAAG